MVYTVKSLHDTTYIRLLDWYDTDRNCSIDIYLLLFCEICTSLARTYVQFLSRSCNTCNKYFKDILDSVSQFNGCYIVGDDIERNVLSIILLFCAQLTFDLILSPRDISRLGIHSYLLHIYKHNQHGCQLPLNFTIKAKTTIFCLK